MNYNRLLDEFSPVEARNAGEFGFVEWLFLLQQFAAFILTLGLFLKILDLAYVGPVLDVISQNAPRAALIVLLFAHVGVILILFILRKPLTFYLVIGFLGVMVIFSIVELFFGNLSGYNIAGVLVSIFWIVYFLVSKKMRLRFLYHGWFLQALLTIYCPKCKKAVILDAEDCGDELTEKERFAALCERITSIEVPMDVRVAQIELLKERFGERALPFLKEQYEKQKSSGLASAKIVSALSHAVGVVETQD
jgi:hypothetical protein